MRLDPQGGTVGAVGRHGLDDVRDAEDSGLEQDILTFETLGIPRAVDRLMVLMHDRRDRPGEIDLAEDRVADLGVHLDHGVLELVELGGLAQDFGGNVELADIVDDPGDLDAFDPVLGEAHLLGDGGGQARHAFLVPGRVRVPHLDGRGQGVYGRPQGRPQLLQALVELRLGLLAFRDVPAQEHHAVGGLVRVAEHGAVDLVEDLFAVLEDEMVFLRADALVEHDLRAGGGPLQVLGRDERENVLAGKALDAR